MNNDLISRSEAEKLGATCLARRNENGQLEAIISLDNAPTVAKDNRPNVCFNCKHCCALSVNSDGEVKVMCNLGAENCYKEADNEVN